MSEPLASRWLVGKTPGPDRMPALDPLPPLERPVSMVMTTGELVTAEGSDDLGPVLDIFRRGEINHLPVLSGGSRLVGVVSSADVLKLSRPPAETRPGWTGVKVADVMTTNIETIRPTVQLREVAQRFASGSFHSLLVTASDGELLGIVTSSDVIRALIGDDFGAGG